MDHPGKHCALAALLGGLILSSSLRGDEQETWPHFKARSAAEAHIYRQLGKVTSADFLDTALSDACEILKDEFGIPVVIDGAALNICGLDSSEPVSISVSGVRLRTILRHLLMPLDLDFAIADDALVITSCEEASRNREVRCYNVASILGDDWTIGSLAAAMELLFDSSAVAVTGGQHGMAPGHGGRGGFGGQPGVGRGRQDVHQVRILANGDVLLVRATDIEHQQVAGMLRSIYDAQQNSVSIHTNTNRNANHVPASQGDRSEENEAVQRPVEDAAGDDPFSESNGGTSPFGDNPAQTTLDEDPFG